MPSKEQLRRFRAELTDLIPWVTVLKRPKKHCAAYTSAWYKLGLKTRVAMTPEGREKYLCKHRGVFHFKGLKGWEGGTTGTYCDVHLRTKGIFATMREDERYIKWVRNNTVIVNRVRMKYGLEPMPTVEE